MSKFIVKYYEITGEGATPALFVHFMMLMVKLYTTTLLRYSDSIEVLMKKWPLHKHFFYRKQFILKFQMI